MMDGMLSLSWKNHSSTFCHTIAALRDKQRYTDATVACDGKFYPVHKFVLSTCSEYFEEMFEHTPCKHPVIVLRDVQCDELEAILNYMYAGVVSVAQSDLSRLIKVAELLKIKGLAVPDEPAETRTSEDRTISRNKRTSPPGRSKTLPVTTDQVNSPSAKRRKTQESLTPLSTSRGSDAEWLKDCSRGEQNLDESCIADEEGMDDSSPLQEALLPETQELHIKDEIIEITSCSDSNHDDTGLDFGTVTEDSKEPETLDDNCQDEVSMLIPKYESSALDSQGAGPLITQPMFSDGLGGTMSGSSEIQAWFPDQEAASSVVMDGDNANTGDTNLQVAKMADSLADIEEINLIEEIIENIAALQPPRVALTERNNVFLSLNDEEFLARFRLSKDSVKFILNEIHFPEFHDGRGAAVPSHIRLLITLRWMTTGGLQLAIADDFEVSQQFLSTCVKETLQSIASNFHRYVQFPDSQAIQAVSQQFQDIAGFPGVLGAIDCTHIPIESPGGERAEEFICKKGFFSLNVQGVCGPNLEFYNIVCRWPGSVHNSRIFANSDLCRKLEQGQYVGHLLGDSAYPLRPYLMTPVANPTREAELKYNTAHAKTSNIEMAFSLWKRRFRVLSSQLRSKLNTSMMAICSAAVLHNIAIKHKDTIPEGEDVDCEVDIRKDYSEREGICNLSTTEGLRKRASIINTVYS
ncbi:uncharacterized protein [Penaeus vannamei]|uniref:uncharacterized protein isoform X1 n=1 Tax=Penaeus vannamei TaxID=6689 RepID=UPI00387F7D15